MACLGKRDANQLEEQVKETLNDLPWAAKSLPKINHFASTSDIFEGFAHVLDIEALEEGDEKERPKLQLKHLLAIADHEQRRILQPLIYNDPAFRDWLIWERENIRESKYWHWAAPAYQLVFTHLCSESNPQLKSVAPNDMKVEDEESRMDWIQDAAKMFHRLMNTKEAHMLNELKIMATWVDSPDAESVY